MVKNNLESMSRLAVFRRKESEPGVPQTEAGVSLDLDSGSGLKCELAVEHDAETIHGSEFPAQLYVSHATTSGALSQKRAKPDFLAFVLAYFFGECQSSLVGSTAYQHLITPSEGLDLPSFTVIQRRGRNIFAERLAGNYLEGFSLELAEGWVSARAEVKGIGAREVNYEHEVVSAPANAPEITLAEKGVAGESASERRENVSRVRAKAPGSQVWQNLVVVSVSADVPAVISFAQPLGQSGDNVDYHVDYLPVEPSWCGLPPAVDESPLRLVEARVVVDGYYDGSELLGGEELRGEVLAFSLTGKNHLELKHFPGSQGPAGYAVRGGRELSISLSESLRDTVREYQASHPQTERLALALLLQGAEIDPGLGIHFGAQLIFPACGILSSELNLHQKRLAQAGDLIVMDDGVYGGAIIKCFNQQSGYL